MSEELKLQAQARALAPFLRTMVFTPFWGDDTYTPEYYGGTTHGTTTHTFQGGSWRRIGNLLVVLGQVNWSAATGTGEARVSLPFAPLTYNAAGSVWMTGVTFANSTPLLTASNGNTYFVLDSPLTNAANTRVQVEAAGTIIFALAYFV